MISLKKLLYALLLFSSAYIGSYAIYHQSNVGRMLTRRFHNWFNKNLSDHFEGVRMIAQATNNKPVTCQISTAKFELKGTYPPNKGDDTVINFINVKRLFKELENPSASGSNIDLQNYGLSYWSFFVLPICLLTSLWIASGAIIRFRWKPVLISFLILFLLIATEFISTLVRMRIGMVNMEPYPIAMWLRKVNNYFNSVLEIEFVFLSTFLIFIICNLGALAKIKWTNRSIN